MRDDDDAKPPPPRDVGSNADEPKDKHRVGKNHPPLATRFPKGKSGNPGGKPKAPPAPDPKAMLSRVLSRPRQYSENGQTRTAAVLEIMYEAAANRATKGDARALREINRLIKEYGLAISSEPEAVPYDYGAELRRKLDEMHERQKQQEE